MLQNNFDGTVRLGDYVLTVSITENGFADRYISNIPRPHRHLGFELHYILDGAPVLVSDGFRAEAPAGRVLLIPPGVAHTSCAGSEARGFNFLFFIEKTPDKDGTPAHRDVNRRMAALLTVRGIHLCQPGGFLPGALEQLRRELSEKPAGYAEQIRFLLGCIFLALALDVLPKPSAEPGGQKNRVQIIEDYFNGACRPSCSPGELAGLLFVSERQLERILLRLYHRNFRMILLDTRMESARYYLCHSALPIRRIAELTGYSSASAFNAAFKRYYRAAPGEVRARAQIQGAS